MMHLILSALIVLLAVLDLLLGIGFLVDPGASGADFGLAADGAQGLSAMRGDFTAFFLVAAGFMGWGAWRRRADLLLAPLALYGVAFVGRLVNLAVEGPFEMWWAASGVELLHVLLLALAIRVWPRPRLGPRLGQRGGRLGR